MSVSSFLCLMFYFSGTAQAGIWDTAQKAINTSVSGSVEDNKQPPAEKSEESKSLVIERTERRTTRDANGPQYHPPADNKIERTSFSALPAGQKNPTLEKQILELSREIAKVEKVGSPKEVKIEDSEWYIDRHKLTGAILSRTIGAWVMFAKNDGELICQNFGFSQEYDGRKYLKLYYNKFKGTAEPCVR